ncbi:MAG: phosphatidylserine decarboxylase [Bacteriovoracaceae bacterium]|nr:phosphatidylserine decarboxylase [Bacteriovoracaceae bacterium]
MEIKYFNRDLEKFEIEKVYGDKAVRWLYESTPGKKLSKYLIKRPLSKFYGMAQESSLSHRKVAPFIKDFNIRIEEYLPEEGRDESDPYRSFNSFFIRRFRDGSRPFEANKALMPAFSEARYFGYESLDATKTIPVKGDLWGGKALLAHEKWGGVFQDGPCLLARLCPVDYHRFHFPDDGKILDHYRVPGVLHSVNPLALKSNPNIFSVNERQVTILETVNFGKLAYVEVGAICVGKIVQSRPMVGAFKRGEEKGYFLFGGSTVIVLGEPGKWKPDEVVIENTNKGIEVYQKLGTRIAEKI